MDGLLWALRFRWDLFLQLSKSKCRCVLPNDDLKTIFSWYSLLVAFVLFSPFFLIKDFGWMPWIACVSLKDTAVLFFLMRSNIQVWSWRCLMQHRVRCHISPSYLRQQQPHLKNVHFHANFMLYHVIFQILENILQSLSVTCAILWFSCLLLLRNST